MAPTPLTLAETATSLEGVDRMFYIV
jgi:hypothetical protein